MVEMSSNESDGPREVVLGANGKRREELKMTSTFRRRLVGERLASPVYPVSLLPSFLLSFFLVLRNWDSK